MIWALALATAVTFALGLWLLQRYYAKATLEVALVRTGLGGCKVVIDRGVLAFPILHRLQKVSMQSITVTTSQTGPNAILTTDKLRADVVVEFELRVTPSDNCIATAAQTLGGRIARGGEAIAEILTGPSTNAIQTAAAARRLDDIHVNRIDFLDDVIRLVESRVQRLGLEVVAASLISLDQSKLTHKDDTNAFNATGSRRLAELIAEERRARIAVETSAEIAVRELRLAQHQRQLELQREERESEIAQNEHLARLEAEAKSREDCARDEARLKTETQRIENEKRVKSAQVESDQALRKAEMEAIRVLEEEKISNDIKIASKRADEAQARADEEEARSKIVLAAENVQAQKERAIANRESEISRMQMEKELSLEKAKIRQEIDIAKTRAETAAFTAAKMGEAERLRKESEAAGLEAMNRAENTLSEAVIQMRLEERKLDRLPEIMTQMMKPVEKIDSIRINQISGIGDGKNSGAGVEGAFSTAMEQILGMAVRLPAMKQLGEEIGLDFDANLSGRVADYANRIKPKSEQMDSTRGLLDTEAARDDDDKFSETS